MLTDSLESTITTRVEDYEAEYTEANSYQRSFPGSSVRTIVTMPDDGSDHPSVVWDDIVVIAAESG